MPINKSSLIDQLRETLQERIAAAEAEIASTLEARNSDTKSSAGDKHEVGRAMVQQELDQLEGQLANTRGLLHEMERVPVDRVYDEVAFGSLVATDQGSFFIAIGMGAVELKGERCFVVSLASPIAQALKGLQAGGKASFKGKSYTILGVE